MGEFVLITGASAGIGEIFARRYAERKQNLIVVARSEGKLKALCDELVGRHGIEAVSIPLDLSSIDAAEVLYDEIKRQGLEVTTLVNNAGFGTIGPFVRMPLERAHSTVNLNVLALVSLTRLFVADFIDADRGTIVNVSSVLASFPMPNSAVYAATKAFVSSFTEALASELSGTGVHVLLLCPGQTETNFTEVAGFDGRLPKFLGQSAEQVVDACLAGLDKEVAVVTPGVHNRLSTLASNVVPNRVIAAVSGLFMPAERPDMSACIKRADEIDKK